jgi:hypothetical protein
MAGYGHDSLEDGRLVASLFADVGIEVLQLYFLPSEVVGEATKRRTLVFVPIFTIKGVLLDALAHAFTVLLQARAHRGFATVTVARADPVRSSGSRS